MEFVRFVRLVLGRSRKHWQEMHAVEKKLWAAAKCTLEEKKKTEALQDELVRVRRVVVQLIEELNDNTCKLNHLCLLCELEGNPKTAPSKRLAEMGKLKDISKAKRRALVKWRGAMVECRAALEGQTSRLLASNADLRELRLLWAFGDPELKDDDTGVLYL